MLAEVGARYESSQAASAHFGDFARSLAREWVDRYSLRGKQLLEIGGGHGDFLIELVRAGVKGGIGFDPLADPSRLGREFPERVQISLERFDERHTSIKADAIVCRHTLEHIQDVSGFLRVLRSWAEQNRGVVLFEVPAAERVLSEYAFWDIYYEHCGYFTQASLEHAFRLAGFRVIRTARVYDGQYLILEAIAGAEGERVASPGNTEQVRIACLAFGERSAWAIERCRSALRRLAAAGRPLVLWQGAAKTVGFLSALADEHLIDCAIDLSVHRHGRFLPPFGLPVFAPDELTKLRPRNIVLMNPAYFREVTSSLQAIGLSTTLLTINQLVTEPREPEAGCA